MTVLNTETREHRLRARIDKLTTERYRYATSLDASTVTDPPREPAPLPPAKSRCVYCGWPVRARACADHRDLVRLDPHYEGTG